MLTDLVGAAVELASCIAINIAAASIIASGVGIPFFSCVWE
jgi:hypothetical protein